MYTNKSIDATNQSAMRPFFAIWTGQAFSLLGSELVQFALVWWLTLTTASATVLATAMLMAVLPRVLISPFAGALVDRWNRRLVMIGADTVSMLAVVVLAGLFAFDVVQVWHVYLVIFIRATCGAFHWPAMQASTTLMVSEEHLARVAGLNQALQGLGAMAAPPLGALLLSVLPVRGVILTDVVTAMVAIVPLLVIAIPQPERMENMEAETQQSITSDLREALQFVRNWPGIMIVIGIAALINLLIFPALSLQPLLVTEHFGGTALHVAWLQSTFGVGMVTGGITLSLWGGFKRRALTGLLALTLSGVGFALVGLTPSNAFPLALVAMFAAWFMNSIANGSLIAVLQIVVPADMQGRVFTLLQSAAGAMIPLGLLVAAPLAELINIQIWFLIAGIFIAGMGIGPLFVPAIMDLDKRLVDPAVEDTILDDPFVANAQAG